MDNNQNRPNNNQNSNKDWKKNTILPIVIAVLAAFLFTTMTSYFYDKLTTKEISYDQFYYMLEHKYVKTVVFDEDKILITPTDSMETNVKT